MGYFDQSGNIKVELLDEKANSLAASFVEINPRNQRPTRGSLSSAQLRRFVNSISRCPVFIANELSGL